MKTNHSPKAFKSTPSIDISSWYKGILSTQLASSKNTGDAFDFVLSNMRKGTEPPPHVHDREDEFCYVLEGSLNVHVGGQVLHLSAGECAFLPRRTPHGFLIESSTIRMLVLIVPGGFMNAVDRMAEPAKKMEIPADDMLTYKTANLEETIKIFDEAGIRLLNADEIAREMPSYPMPVAQ